MESIRETLERAGGVPESARVAIDGGVDAAVQTVSKQVAIAAEHVSGYAGVARAHADAASVRFREYEDRLFRTPTATVARLVTTCPYQTAGVALGASLLMVPSARDSVANAEKELKRLRDAAVAAEVEMLRGRNALERAARELKALARRAKNDGVVVDDALDDLRRLPSAAAVAARADAALTATQVAKVRRGVDAALAGVWRAGVQI